MFLPSLLTGLSATLTAGTSQMSCRNWALSRRLECGVEVANESKEIMTLFSDETPVIFLLETLLTLGPEF